MKSKFVLFLIALIIWFCLTFNFRTDNIVIGFLASVLVAFLTGDLFTKNPQKFKGITRYLWFLYYVPIFTRELIKANLDVAYRVIHPALPIKPGIVKVRTNLKSDSGITFLANSITLTPGTMSVDYVDGYLYIHWIYVHSTEDEKKYRMIAEKFEKILLKIFE